MKPKNVMLGIIAFVFAIGTAFASLSVMDQHAQITDPAPVLERGCKDIADVCSMSGDNTCKVTVGQLPGQYIVYEDNTCVTEVKNLSANPIPTNLE